MQKKIVMQCLHAQIFKGDLLSCYSICLKSPIRDVRMAVSDLQLLWKISSYMLLQSLIGSYWSPRADMMCFLLQ